MTSAPAAPAPAPALDTPLRTTSRAGGGAGVGGRARRAGQDPAAACSGPTSPSERRPRRRGSSARAPIVCVVGEFKQGKSSLVNGLLGQAICPVDDDLATSAITLVRYGERGRGDRRCATRRGRRPPVSEPVADRRARPTGSARPATRATSKQVERVEITVPEPAAEAGPRRRRHARHGRARRRPRRRDARRSCPSPTG